MKFLDLATLSRINSFLDSVDVGDLIVKGDLEAYSCEHACLCAGLLAWRAAPLSARACGGHRKPRLVP